MTERKLHITAILILLISFVASHALQAQQYGSDTIIKDHHKTDPEAMKIKQKGDRLYIDQKYPEALEAYTLAMEKARYNGDTDTYYRAMANAGMIYDIFGDYQRALYYLDKVLAADVAASNRDLKAGVLERAVVSACNGQDLKLARKYYKMQLATPRRNASMAQYYRLVNGGLIYELGRQYPKAERNYRQALRLARSKHLEKPMEVSMLDAIADVLQEQGMLDSALTVYAQCAALARRYSLDAYLADAYAAMSDTYRMKGNDRQAMHYERLSLQLGATVYSQKRFNKAKNKLLVAEDKQHKATVKGLTDRIEFQWTIIVAFIVLVSALVVALLFIRWQKKRIIASYRLLIDKDRCLDSCQVHDMQPEPPGSEQHCSTQGAAPGSPSQPAPTLDASKLQLLQRIDQVMRDPDFIFSPQCSRDELCRQVGSNYKYVSSLINDHYQKSFKALVNEKRMREAKLRLASPQYSHVRIEQLALDLGYSSSSSFIGAFKKAMGMTPAIYRKLASK